MATPLKIKDGSGNIQEMTTSDENYIAYQIGLHLAASDSAGDYGSINTNSSFTSIGSYTNTFFNEPVGTAPSTSITSGSTTTTVYQNQSQNAAETDSDTQLPLMWVDAGGQTGFKQMPDLDLNDAVDRYLSTIFTNDYPGSFRLASSSPGGDYSIHIPSVFTDTRTDGTSVAYNIYQRDTITPPTAVRPMYVEDSAGGSGMKIRAMTDRQIKYSFGQRAKNRIGGSKIGSYQLRSSAQGAPTDPGTWVAKGTADDTKQTTSDVSYTRSFETNYEATYVKGYTTDYSNLYSSLYTTAFDQSYTSLYSNEYSLATRDLTYPFLGPSYESSFETIVWPYTRTLGAVYSSQYLGFGIQYYQGDPNYSGPAYVTNYLRNLFYSSAVAGEGGFVGGYANFLVSYGGYYGRTYTEQAYIGGSEVYSGDAYIQAYTRSVFYDSLDPRFYGGYYTNELDASIYGLAYFASVSNSYDGQSYNNFTQSYSKLQRYVTAYAGPAYYYDGIPGTGQAYDADDDIVRTGPEQIYYTSATYLDPGLQEGVLGYTSTYVAGAGGEYTLISYTQQPYVPNYTSDVAYTLTYDNTYTLTYTGARIAQYTKLGYYETFAVGRFAYYGQGTTVYYTAGPGTAVYVGLGPTNEYGLSGWYEGPAMTFVNFIADGISATYDPGTTYNRVPGFINDQQYSRFYAGPSQFSGSVFYVGASPSKYTNEDELSNQQYTREDIAATFTGPGSYTGFLTGFATVYGNLYVGERYIGQNFFVGQYGNADYYTGTYVPTYTLAPNYTRIQGPDYSAAAFLQTVNYQKVYSGAFQAPYDKVYSRSNVYDITYVGPPNVFTGPYQIIPTYTGPAVVYSKGFLRGSYTRNYTRQLFYAGRPGPISYYVRVYSGPTTLPFYEVGYTGAAGLYTNPIYYSGNYTGSSNYIRRYSAPMSFYTTRYSGGLNYLNEFTTLYAGIVADRAGYDGPGTYLTEYLGALSYQQGYGNTYLGDAYVASYVGATYTSYYTLTFAQFTPAGVSYEKEYTQAGTFIAYYTGAMKFNVYLGEIIGFTSRYLGGLDDYTRQYEAGTAYGTIYGVEYTKTFSIPYLVEYETGYTNSYTNEYANEFAASYTDTYESDYLTDYLNLYTGSFEGETIDATDEIIETYTLYVRIA